MENILVCPNCLKISTLLKEIPLKMSEFLNNQYFFNEKSPSYILIPEKDVLIKKNVLVLPEFLKNKNFVKGKSPSLARILEK
jgi:hypothetical protein